MINKDQGKQYYLKNQSLIILFCSTFLNLLLFLFIYSFERQIDEMIEQAKTQTKYYENIYQGEFSKTLHEGKIFAGQNEIDFVKTNKPFQKENLGSYVIYDLYPSQILQVKQSLATMGKS